MFFFRVVGTTKSIRTVTSSLVRKQLSIQRSVLRRQGFMSGNVCLGIVFGSTMGSKTAYFVQVKVLLAETKSVGSLSIW